MSAPAPSVDAESATLDQRLRSLPWWRRPRRLRREVAWALVLTALLAVATFGGVNFFAARDLLVRETEQQLANVAATRAESIAAGTERVVSTVSVASGDLAIVGALEDFTAAFRDLSDRTLTPAESAELDAWYAERVIDQLDEAGLGPVALSDVVPTDPSARWVQYHYTVRSPGQPPPIDPGDGSRYTEVNADVEASAQQFSSARGGGDVLLIDDTGTVVYTLFKRNDVGTNLVSGPYANTALAQVVTNDLPRARVGDTLLTDFGLSTSGRPSMYAVSAVSSGTRVLGALAVEIPVALLNEITSASGGWSEIGLAEGDSYVVTPEQVLQSEPRAWLDDPDGYLEQLRAGDETDQAEAQLIDVVGSPVGVQVIDTAAVRAALDGEEYRGLTRDYFGRSVFAASESFTAGGQQFVVVTEAPRSAALAPLSRYLLRILVVLVIVIPVVAAIGVWLSRVLSRPIRPSVEAAQSIVAGDRDPDLDTARRDEFGDLARRLAGMARALAAHEAELSAEYERTRQLLLSVLPPQLVDEDGSVVGTGEAAERATVVAVTLAPSDEHADHEMTSHALRQAAGVAEQLADGAGLQRVRTSADRYLFLAGMGSEDTGADDAVAFAGQLRSALDAADVDALLDLHIGLSTGPVATGVFDTGSLTFGAWGDPVRRALALAALSEVDVLLVDATTAQACDSDRWSMREADDILDLDGEQMELYTVGVGATTVAAGD